MRGAGWRDHTRGSKPDGDAVIAVGRARHVPTVGQPVQTFFFKNIWRSLDIAIFIAYVSRVFNRHPWARRLYL
jgi:hypothetical protein